MREKGIACAIIGCVSGQRVQPAIEIIGGDEASVNRALGGHRAFDKPIAERYDSAQFTHPAPFAG
jgi:hypothetical protein